MSRARLPIGTFGAIDVTRNARGTFAARTRYRDWDGARRLVQATGPTRAAAESALKRKLADRSLLQPAAGADLTPDSGFPGLVDYWLAQLDLEGALSTNTRVLYERDMRTLVLPAFKDLTLREIGVARCDRFLQQLAKQSYSKANHARQVLRLAFGLAVRHEFLSRNPMDGVGRLRRPPHTPDALTVAEVDALRIAIAAWEQGRLGQAGPPPDHQLGAIIEVMLGTSARIGEALAIRRCDVDVTSSPATVRIAGTVITARGVGTIRQDHPKTARSRRTIAVPSFTASALRTALARSSSRDPEAFVFATREGTPLQANNVRRALRRILAVAGIDAKVTPHMFRRTVATLVADRAGVDLAAELLGHTDPRITIQHYIRRSEAVNPVTAQLLEEALGPGA